MRIVLATLHYAAGSSSSLVDEAIELAALGNDVCVFATGDNERDARVDGRDLGSGSLRVLAPRSGRWGRLALLAAALVSATIRHPVRLLRLVRAVRRRVTSRGQRFNTLYLTVPLLARRADIVHFTWIDLAKMSIDLLPLLDAPVVVTCTGSDLRVNPLSDEKYHLLIRAVFDRVDLVRCFSEDLRQRALELGLDPGKAIVNYCGVDASFFSSASGHAADEVVETRTRAFQVVGVGHLHWVKGFEYALQAVSEVQQAGVDISYEILGGDAGALQSVRTAIRDFELEEHVLLRGGCSRAEVLEALRSADAFMLASLSEGRCAAKLEAMAVGVPVVVTDVGGMSEGLTNGVDALLVPTRDPAALAKALLDLAADPARRKQIGEAGQERVRIEGGAQASAQVMLEQYQRLIDEKSAR